MKFLYFIIKIFYLSKILYIDLTQISYKILSLNNVIIFYILIFHIL
jgi:hypothetical protein